MTNFAFVVNDPAALTGSEAGLRNFITGLGHTVSLVAPGVDATTATGGVKPVVISEAIASAALSPTYKTITVPIITFEGGVLVALGLSTANATAQSTNTLNFVANEPLTGGVVGSKQFTVAGSGTPNMTMLSSYATKLGAGAKYLAYSGSGTTDLAAFYYLAGSTLSDGSLASGLRIFFGFRDQGATNWFGDGVTAPGLSSTTGIPFVKALVDAAAAAAAGGGSVPAPVANAGADIAARHSSPVRLDGSGTPGNSGTLSYSWTQTGGTAVTLNGSGTATPWFVTPSTDAVLTFLVTVTETPGGRTSIDEVTVTVSGDARVAYPTADVTTAGWSKTPTGAASHFSILDDLDVTDYSTSPENPTGQPLQVSVSLGAEGSGTVSFFTLLSAVGGSASVVVTLLQGGSAIATQTFNVTSANWFLAKVDVPATSINWTLPVTVSIAPTVS